MIFKRVILPEILNTKNILFLHSQLFSTLNYEEVRFIILQFEQQNDRM